MRRNACVLLFGLAASVGAAAQTLTLHYQERPPYSQRLPDGSVAGLVATPAADALRAAGVPFRWELTPSQRQLALIQSGSGLHCGVGWFRNPERELRGRFSAPLYRDKPFAALVRNDLAMPERVSFAGLAERQLLVKEGYSYGPEFDRLIALRARAPVATSVENAQMARMLALGRADWMLVAPEEAGELMQSGLRLVTLADAPAGPSRHLYCSGDVPAEWMARIDQSLAPPRR